MKHREQKPDRNFMAKAMYINRTGVTKTEPPKKGQGSKYKRSKSRDSRFGSYDLRVA